MILALAVPLAACGSAPSPHDKAREDAAAIAEVKAAQDDRPPVAAITLLPLGTSAAEKYDGGGSGCSLTVSPDGAAVLALGPRRAVIKTGPYPTMLASDPGSAKMPLDTWAHYVGKDLSVTVEKGAGTGAVPGVDALEWPARVTVRDAWDRMVYTGSGTLRCGA